MFRFASLMMLELFPHEVISSTIGISDALSQTGKIVVPYLDTFADGLKVHPMVPLSSAFLVINGVGLILLHTSNSLKL